MTNKAIISGVIKIPNNKAFIINKIFNNANELLNICVLTILDTHNIGPTTISNNGVNNSSIIQQNILQNKSLTRPHSFYLTHPGINAGQPKGLNIAKWIGVYGQPQIQHHSCKQY